MTSVCKCRVNVWNVKGRMLPGHGHARDDAGAVDPVVRRTKKRCLWRKVSDEWIEQGLYIHSMRNMVRREARLYSKVRVFAKNYANIFTL